MADLGWLFERMAAAADRDAVIHDEHVVTYAALLDLVAGARVELRRRQVGPGRTVALVGDFSAATCAMLLALIENDTIITPLMPGSYARHPEFLDISEVQVVVTLEDGGLPRIDFAPRSIDNELNLRLVDARAPGLVLYSSGSTGASKGALHDFRLLLDKFRRLRPALRTLTFLLLDHIGGVNTLFHTLTNGGTVVAVRDRRPDRVCEAIEKHRVELLPVSPAFLNLLMLSGEHQHHDLSSLQLITYGTEPMPESTLQRVADAFPNVRLQQTYGLTEVGILRSQSRDNRSLWVRIGGEGYETRVADGILWIKARSSMLGYLNAPSPFDAEGWLCTGDLVEVDGEWLRILGRREEIINVGGLKVYPAEVESAILGLPNIRDVVVFGEPHAITGQIVVAAVNIQAPEERLALKQRLHGALRDTLAAYKIPQKVVVTDEAIFNERYKRLRLNRTAASERTET